MKLESIISFYNKHKIALIPIGETSKTHTGISFKKEGVFGHEAIHQYLLRNFLNKVITANSYGFYCYDHLVIDVDAIYKGEELLQLEFKDFKAIVEAHLLPHLNINPFIDDVFVAKSSSGNKVHIYFKDDKLRTKKHVLISVNEYIFKVDFLSRNSEGAYPSFVALNNETLEALSRTEFSTLSNLQYESIKKVLQKKKEESPKESVKPSPSAKVLTDFMIKMFFSSFSSILEISSTGLRTVMSEKIVWPLKSIYNDDDIKSLIHSNICKYTDYDKNITEKMLANILKQTDKISIPIGVFISYADEILMNRLSLENLGKYRSEFYEKACGFNLETLFKIGSEKGEEEEENPLLDEINGHLEESERIILRILEKVMKSNDFKVIYQYIYNKLEDNIFRKEVVSFFTASFILCFSKQQSFWASVSNWPPIHTNLFFMIISKTGSGKNIIEKIIRDISIFLESKGFFKYLSTLKSEISMLKSFAKPHQRSAILFKNEGFLDQNVTALISDTGGVDELKGKFLNLHNDYSIPSYSSDAQGEISGMKNAYLSIFVSGQPKLLPLLDKNSGGMPRFVPIIMHKKVTKYDINRNPEMKKVKHGRYFSNEEEVQRIVSENPLKKEEEDFKKVCDIVLKYASSYSKLYEPSYYEDYLSNFFNKEGEEKKSLSDKSLMFMRNMKYDLCEEKYFKSAPQEGKKEKKVLKPNNIIIEDYMSMFDSTEKNDLFTYVCVRNGNDVKKAYGKFINDINESDHLSRKYHNALRIYIALQENTNIYIEADLFNDIDDLLYNEIEAVYKLSQAVHGSIGGKDVITEAKMKNVYIENHDKLDEFFMNEYKKNKGSGKEFLLSSYKEKNVIRNANLRKKSSLIEYLSSYADKGMIVFTNDMKAIIYV